MCEGPTVFEIKINPPKYFDKFSQVPARDQPGTRAVGVFLKSGTTIECCRRSPSAKAPVKEGTIGGKPPLVRGVWGTSHMKIKDD